MQATSSRQTRHWVCTSWAGILSTLDSGFLWGVAASEFQSEGHAPEGNWTRHIPSHHDYDAMHDSVDFYDRFASDIDLAAALGVRERGILDHVAHRLDYVGIDYWSISNNYE